MKWLLIVTLAVLSILVVIPPIRYHYIYPTAGDDTASHLIYFQNMDNQEAIYGGQYLVGKLVNALPFDSKTTFLWFHYIILISAFWVVGITMSLAINPLAGILASIMMFGKTYLLELFHWGQIFDIIGIAILLPLLLLCLHKMYNGSGWKFGVALLWVAFGLFHANGRYLLALIPIMAVYELVFAISLHKHNTIALRLQRFRILAYSGLLGVALLIIFAARVPVTPEPMRQLMDSSILLVMFVCGVIGYYVYSKSRLVAYSLIIAAILITMPTLIQWEQNNNVFKNADKDAIAYLNSLDGKTYTASARIAQDVYGLFLNEEFQDNSNADYLIDRTLPLTPRSDPQSVYFQNKDRINATLDGYKLLKVFDNGEIDRILGLPVIVSVYGK